MTEVNTLDRTEIFSSKAQKNSGHFITILDGRERLRQIDLNEYGLKEITFGRLKDTAMHISIDSPYAACIHGRFVFEQGQWYVENFATNGIFCNGVLIDRCPLFEGDTLRFGGKKKGQSGAVLFQIS